MDVMNMAEESLWQTEGWYKVIPFLKEDRGNLKCLGIQAPFCLMDVGGITIIHIRENLPYQNIIELNVNLRNIFGPATLVLALDKDIAFYKIEKCSQNEVKDYRTFGNPVLQEVKEIGYSDPNTDKRYEIEESGRQVTARNKSGIRRIGSKSNRKTQRA